MPRSGLLQGLLKSASNNIRPKFFSTQFYNSINPLVPAIRDNNLEAVRSIVREGISLKLADFREILRTGAHNLNLEIIDHLYSCDALPEGVSPPSLKLVLWAMGHAKCKLNDIVMLRGIEELNYQGIPGMPSPMLIVASGARLQAVIDLICYLDDPSRPIDQILRQIRSNHFLGCNFLDIERFKQNITKQLNAYQFDELCRVVRCFLLNPTKDLDRAFARQHQTLKTEGLYYLPFVAWLAVNNNVELFESSYFIELMQLDKKSAKEAAIIATAFGSLQFLRGLIEARLIEQEDIEKAANLAAANGDNRLLDFMLPLLKEPRTQNSEHNKATNALTPLYWAIQNGHLRTVYFLLKANPTLLKAQNEQNGGNYLHLAAKLATTEHRLTIMRLLIAYDADLNQLNKENRTPLHLALETHNSKERNLDKSIRLLLATKITNLEHNVDGTTTRDLLFKHVILNTVKPTTNTTKEDDTNDEITPGLRM